MSKKPKKLYCDIAGYMWIAWLCGVLGSFDKIYVKFKNGKSYENRGVLPFLFWGFDAVLRR
jgi:hypothetical protein